MRPQTGQPNAVSGQATAEAAQMGMENLYVTLNQLGREDIIASLGELPDALVQRIADVFNLISNEQMRISFIEDLGDAAGVDDFQGEVGTLLTSWENRLNGRQTNP